MIRKIALLCALMFGLPAMAQFVTITDTGVTNLAGDPLALGTECFTPVNQFKTPIAANYPGGTITKAPKCSPITAGTMTSIQLVKSTVTNPNNLCYMRTIVDRSNGAQVIGPNDGFSCLQISVDSNMNGVVPSTLGLPLILLGPAGHDGSPGPPGADGPSGIGSWHGNFASTGVSYAVGDGVHATDGSAYVNILACAAPCTHDPISSPTYWSLAAAAGATGPTGGGVSAAALGGYVQAELPQYRNLLDQSLIAPGNFFTCAGVTSSGDHSVTGFIPVKGLSAVAYNFNAADSVAGAPCLYDENFASLGVATMSPSSGAGHITIPSGAAYVRLNANGSTSATWMVVPGTVVPSTPIGFGFYDPTTTDAHIAAGVASAVAAVTSVSPKISIREELPQVRNLFDPTLITPLKILNETDGTYFSTGDHFVTGYIPVLSLTTIISNARSNDASSPPFGYVFYDINKAYLSGGFAGASTPITVPTGAAYYRQGANNTLLNTMMVVAGSTLPSSYISFGYYDPATTDARIAAGVATVSNIWSGKHLAVWGDSVCDAYHAAWLPTLLSLNNMTLSFADCLSGRTSKDAFQNYGTAATCTPMCGSPSGTSNGTATGSGISNDFGVSGHTLATDLTGIDVLIYTLGVNDAGYASGALGTSADLCGTGSLWGYYRCDIEGFQKANPAMRIIFVTPYYYDPCNGHAGGVESYQKAVVNTMIAVAGEYGIPVINMFANSGIGPMNWYTTPYTMPPAVTTCSGSTTGMTGYATADGVHPGTFGGVRMGSYIASAMRDLF